MTAPNEITETLRKGVAELKLRVKQVGKDNRDLRDIRNGNDVEYEERLAARRHKRYFAQLCAEHPIGRTVKASDVKRWRAAGWRPQLLIR